MKRLLFLVILLVALTVGCDDFVTPAGEGDATLTLNIIWCDKDSTEPECLDQDEDLTYAHDEY